jgi:hypothetical protein
MRGLCLLVFVFAILDGKRTNNVKKSTQDTHKKAEGVTRTHTHKKTQQSHGSGERERERARRERGTLRVACHVHLSKKRSVYFRMK